MFTTTPLDTIQRAAASGAYTIAPVGREILADDITPIEALRAFKAVSDRCYLLESVVGRERRGRYTFLGFEPSLAVTCTDGRITIGDRIFHTDDPSERIREILSRYRSPRIEGMPPFTGGLVGYFAFEYLKYAEPTVRRDVDNPHGLRDLELMLFDKVVAFDNVRQTVTLIVNMPLDGDLKVAYNQAVTELDRLERLLREGERWRNGEGRLTGPIAALFSRDQFRTMVERAKSHIHEGDIFQIVPSNQLSAPFEGSLLDTYRVLRVTNPSPYMFYLSGTDIEIAGASPETLVRLENGVLHTFPLAGTRPRGTSDEEDLRLERELLADPKELAEHNMLVDLGRNDLGRVSRFGSVQVERLRDIERYSHVMHIASNVRGELREDCDALDAIAAVLPAGTLSGAPKIRACQLIGEMEGVKRGVYGGAIGYLDFTGNMDVCIGIRLAFAQDGRVFVRAGAGIVADSVPDNEYQECLNKAGATLDALRIAGEGMR
ncbi:anthranilate synthase component I family protein [Bifidobacterium pullorum subsp. saeculare]|uniref:anthranilate synthase component I family protein n=1 Tax=Bifidobacterium pullorum TaxID=78448 RepID=UPI00195980E6|nr:anthranilate synthase component I family protein [Bifidobacterium pullorum]MBM6706135.1 anthranilate synthase component I family protein [Bifidobacterium pullorum subsp. saeculare]